MTIPDILAECDKTLALAEKATPGPWHIAKGGLGNTERLDTVYATHEDLHYICACRDFACIHDRERNTENAALIAHSRTFTPDAARALKVAIEALRDKSIYETTMPESQRTATNALQSIINSFTHEQH